MVSEAKRLAAVLYTYLLIIFIQRVSKPSQPCLLTVSKLLNPSCLSNVLISNSVLPAHYQCISIYSSATSSPPPVFLLKSPSPKYTSFCKPFFSSLLLFFCHKITPDTCLHHAFPLLFISHLHCALGWTVHWHLNST